MLQPRRTSRVWETPVASVEEAQKFPAVTLDLIEQLERAFPIGTPQHTGGLDGAVDAAIQAAEQRGEGRVISFLRSINEKQLAR